MDRHYSAVITIKRVKSFVNKCEIIGTIGTIGMKFDPYLQMTLRVLWL
jgi:hypothetical protein